MLSFYAIAKPVLIAFNLFLIALFIKSKKIKKGLVITSILLIIVWVSNDFNFFRNPIDKENDISILYWNIARNKDHLFLNISENVKKFNPDVIGLVEADDIDINIFQNIPNYTFKKIGSDIIVGTKGDINNISVFNTDHFYKYNKIEVEVNSELYTITIVDIYANQPYFRKRILNDFYNAIKNDKNSIVFGDFNTPYESLHLKSFKTNMWNAERKAGKGFIASWPHGIPLIQIDHIWSAKNLTPIYSDKNFYDTSDHPLIFATFKKM